MGVNVCNGYSGDLAFTEDLSFNEPRFQVLRSHQELHELYDRALTPDCPECEYEPLPFIDWSVSTVVLVAHEIVSSGGYSIAIDAVTRDNNRLTIDVVKTSPGDNCAVSAAFTGPYQLYKFQGIFENIDFVELTVQSPAC